MLKIKLTANQKKQLEPLFDAVANASACGEYGAIGAQIWPDGMCVMFFDAKRGRALSKALGGNFRNTSCTAQAMMESVPPNNK